MGFKWDLEYQNNQNVQDIIQNYLANKKPGKSQLMWKRQPVDANTEIISLPYRWIMPFSSIWLAKATCLLLDKWPLPGSAMHKLAKTS